MKATTAGYFLGLALVIGVPAASVDVPSVRAVFQQKSNPVNTQDEEVAGAGILAGAALMYASKSAETRTRMKALDF